MALLLGILAIVLGAIVGAVLLVSFLNAAAPGWQKDFD